MKVATFVAALQEQGIPAVVLDDSPHAWVDLDDDQADPYLVHRAMTLAGASIDLGDWIAHVTVTGDEADLDWLERWGLA